MKNQIVITKRNWYGKLKVIATYSSYTHELVISTGGVLTIRKKESRASVLALNCGEWSRAVAVNGGV